MNGKAHIAVVGGANIDITAAPHHRYVPHDSNPGSITMSYGGVGRNIAHNLSLMGCEVSLVTVFGDDDFAAGLKRDCERIGIDIRHSETLRGKKSSVFACINDEHGEMMSAVSAMDIMDCLTPEFMSSRIAMLNSCDAVVVETNIPSETIAYVLDNCKSPIFADTVSSAKSHKILDALCSTRVIHTLKMNRIEAQALIKADANGLESAVATLHQKGVERIFITLGSDGCYYHDAYGSRQLPCEKAKVVNTCGAGDAFLSGTVLAFTKGLDTESTIKCALRAAAITVQCSEAVNPEINEKYVLNE